MTDHHHEHELTNLVRSELASAIANPVVLGTIMSSVSESIANNMLLSSERNRPVRSSEAVVEFKEYNAQGDTLMLIRRRLRYCEGAATIIISFEQDPDDANNITFSTVIYSDHPTDTTATKFIEVSGDALNELNRQISELYKPDMLGKSIQLMLVTYPAYFAPKDTGE